MKMSILGRGMWKAVAPLPISACLQNEQANFDCMALYEPRFAPVNLRDRGSNLRISAKKYDLRERRSYFFGRGRRMIIKRTAS